MPKPARRYGCIVSTKGERASLFPRRYDRGVTYWKSPEGEERIYAVTAGYNLVALDAKTGVPVPSFGSKGVVDLYTGLERVKAGEIGSTSPPLVVKDVIIVGTALKNGTSPMTRTNVPADIRGYEVRSGPCSGPSTPSHAQVSSATKP